MQRNLVVSVLTVLTLQFASGPALSADKIKIGFVLSTLQEERYQKDQKYFLEEAARLGFEAIVVAADNNPQTQTAKVENLFSQGVKALVIQPVNSKAAANLVKLAHEDKVPVIAYDRLITDAPVDFYVTQDSVKVGVLEAEAGLFNGKRIHTVLQRGRNLLVNTLSFGLSRVPPAYSPARAIKLKIQLTEFI